MGGPYRGKLLVVGETVLAHLPEVGKGFWKIPHQSWLTGGNAPCDWARATSQTNTFSVQTKRSSTLEVYDDSLSTAGHKKTFEQLSKHHRSRERRQRLPPVPPPAAPEVHEDEDKNADVKEKAHGQTRDDIMGVAWDSRHKQRRREHRAQGEVRNTEVQARTLVKERLGTKSPKTAGHA